MFDIYYNETPVVYLLHKNHYYRYYGDIASIEELIEFATEGFDQYDHYERIPKLPSIWEEIVDIFDKEVQHRGGYMKSFLFLDDKGEP